MISDTLRTEAAKVPEARRDPELHQKLQNYAAVLDQLEEVVAEVRAEVEGPVKVDRFELIIAEALDLIEWAGELDGYQLVTASLSGMVAALTEAEGDLEGVSADV